MPILGVIKETLESDGGSMRGDDDFFSVARTIPLVAIMVLVLGFVVSELTRSRAFLPLIPSDVTP